MILRDGEYKVTLEEKCRHLSGFECSTGPRATPTTPVSNRDVGTGSRRVSQWWQICNSLIGKIPTLCLTNILLWQPFHRCRATKQQIPACQLIFPRPPRPREYKRFPNPIGSRHQIGWHSRVGAGGGGKNKNKFYTTPLNCRSTSNSTFLYLTPEWLLQAEMKKIQSVNRGWPKK